MTDTFEPELKRRIELAFGKRCEDYDKECHVCNAWTFYDYLTGEQE